MQKKKNHIASNKHLLVKFLCFIELGPFPVHIVAHLFINVPTGDFKTTTKLEIYSHSSLNGINSVAERAFPVLVTWDIQEVFPTRLHKT